MKTKEIQNMCDEICEICDKKELCNPGNVFGEIQRYNPQESLGEFDPKEQDQGQQLMQAYVLAVLMESPLEGYIGDALVRHYAEQAGLELPEQGGYEAGRKTPLGDMYRTALSKLKQYVQESGLEAGVKSGYKTTKECGSKKLVRAYRGNKNGKR
ncbi:hypothetical protein ACFLZN_02450 [Nanoarchaeota archaeon]